MEVKKVVTGAISENCYVLIDQGNCLVVDPGDEFSKIKEVIGTNKVVGVLLTHSHFDHVGALREVMNLSKKIQLFKRSMLVEKTYTIENFTFDCLFTPGHSSDSVTYYFKEEQIMFVGDFIFKEGIGRCDLPTGDFKVMKDSLRKISTYPKNTILYPGHDEDTTLGYELENNPYMQEV